MSDEQDPDEAGTLPQSFSLSGDDLTFLQNEGLDMLYAFRGIRDRRKRVLILELARAIVEAQPPVDGH